MVNKIYLNRVSVHGVQDAIDLFIVNDYGTKSNLIHRDLKNSISSSEESCNSTELR